MGREAQEALRNITCAPGITITTATAATARIPATARIGNFDSRQSLRGATQALALVILLAGGLLDLPRDVPFGPVSGQAVLTVLYFVAGAFIVPMIPAQGSALAIRTLPLAIFFIWAATSLAWTTAISNGIQNVMAIGTFVVMLLVGGLMASLEPDFGFWLDKRLRWSVGLALTIYCTSLAIFGAGSNDIVSARSFGLFALFGVAQQLARWRYGARTGLLWAAVITFLIGASESRLALGIAVVLFPLAQTPTRRVVQSLKMLAVLVAAAALSYAAFVYFDALRERFLTGDISLKIGSVAINGTGRSALWRLTAGSIDDALIAGHGAGTAEELVASVYGDVSHPHNDYLRVLNDYGLIGTTIWIFGLVVLLVSLWRRWRVYDGRSPGTARLQLTALLSLVAFTLEMTAENALVYVFLTAPLGLIVGSAAGKDAVWGKHQTSDRFRVRR